MLTDPLLRVPRAVGRGLGRLAVGSLALLLLFEEWGWEPLHRGLIRLRRLRVMRRTEAAITGLPPGAALTVLLLPTLVRLGGGALGISARVLGLAHRPCGQVAAAALGGAVAAAMREGCQVLPFSSCQAKGET